MKILKPIYYLYYRYYRVIKSVNLKTSYYQARVIFFFSIVTGSNIAIVIKISNLEMGINKYYLVAGILIWFFFWFFIFSRSKRLSSLNKRFEKESLTHRIIGGIGVILYSLASFIIFIIAVVNST